MDGTKVPLSLLRDHFDKWLKDINATQDTEETYRTITGHFMIWINAYEFITPDLLRSWRDNIEGKPATINLHLTVIRSFLNWAMKQGYTESNPATSISGISREDTRVRDELTAEEIKAVMHTCDDSLVGIRDRAILGLMAYTGLRTVEIYRADIDDLNTRKGRRLLWIQGKGHSAKDDFVVIPAIIETDLIYWLKDRPDKADKAIFTSLSKRSYGQRLSRVAIRAMVKKRYRLAGVIGTKKTTHSLRHSAITTAIEKGASPTQVKALARHKDFNTTMKYFHDRNRIEYPAEDLISYD